MTSVEIYTNSVKYNRDVDK